jgi:AraC-like DNA-binding protein
MPLIDHYKMAATLGRSLHSYCETRQLDLTPAAKAVGIDPEDFQDAKRFINFSAFTSLLEHLAFLANDELFGLKYGSYFRLGDSGSFGFGLLNAPNFCTALKFYSNFIKLTADYANFKVEENQLNTTISWSYSPLIVQCSQYSDMMTVLSVRSFKNICGQSWLPSSVGLIRKRPSCDALHRATMSPAIRFASNNCDITFKNTDLKFENLNADVRLYDMMVESCEEGLRRRMINMPLEINVREEVLNHLATGKHLLPKVAQRMKMSGRNLQRRLQFRGTNFESVVEETRRELTVSLLASTDLALSEIADRIGYSGVNAFSRAAKNWFGVSPGAFRQTLMAETRAR